MGAKGFFTIAHFDGFAAVLVQLDKVAKRPLREAIEDAWLACAPDAARPTALPLGDGRFGQTGAPRRRR